MAAGTKIVLEFTSATGSSARFSYNYANADANAALVKNAMNTMITQNAIFKSKPAAIQGAKIVVTTETEYDLDNA